MTSTHRPASVTACRVISITDVPASSDSASTSDGDWVRARRQEFPDLVRHYYRANKLWSGSYFAGSVGGDPLSVVKQYIEQQDRPGQGTARA